MGNIRWTEMNYRELQDRYRSLILQIDALVMVHAFLQTTQYFSEKYVDVKDESVT